MINWQSKVIAPSVRVFGQPGVYRRGAEQFFTDHPLSGIFDSAFSFVDVAGGVEVVSTAPCFGINLADLPFTPVQKDQILIYASPFGAPAVDTLYAVKKVMPDGHGACRLLLNLAPQPPDITSSSGTQDQ